MMKLTAKFSFPWLLLGVLALGVLLRLIFIDSREFWYDEPLSLLLVNGQKVNYEQTPDVPIALRVYQQFLSVIPTHSLQEKLALVIQVIQGILGEPHPPLFFLSQHMWLQLFGSTELAMRSLGVCYSVGTLFCAYGLAKKLLGYQGGLLFAGLLGLNDYYLFHSLNVRMYGSLVFWVMLSSWSLLETISWKEKNNREEKNKVLWSMVLIISLVGGLMTFYFYAYFILALGLVVILWDRKHIFSQMGKFLLAILITLPWMLWGFRQQLNNIDTERFAKVNGLGNVIIKHGRDFFDTLGIHLIVGDWASSLPSWTITFSGFIAVIFLILITVDLWKKKEKELLLLGLILGLFPLLIGFTRDCLSGQFTISFGWGRSTIMILPGLILLITIWLQKLTISSRKWVIGGVILTYLLISIGDFGSRSRVMFHQITALLEQSPQTPTLIVMNTKAWGNVLRLAYYSPVTQSIDLLSQSPSKLPDTLETTLETAKEKYPRILSLQFDRPLWSAPKTLAEKKQIETQVKTILNRYYKLQETHKLSGTMELDKISVSVYQNSP